MAKPFTGNERVSTSEIDRRNKVARFFGSRLNVGNQLALFGLMVVLAVAAYLVLGIYPIARVVLVVAVLIALVPLVRLVIYKLFTGIPSEEYVLQVLQSDWNSAAQRASQRLNLPQDDQERSVCIIGQIMADNGTEVRKDIPYAKGKNDVYYYAANRVIVFKFSKHIIGVYLCDINSIEPTYRGILKETAFECYYTDIESFELADEDPLAELLLSRFNLQRLNTNPLSLAKKVDSIFADLLSSQDERFTVRKLFLVTRSGQRIGTSIGVVRKLDKNGEPVLDELDRDIDKARTMIRDKKYLGFRERPVYYEQQQ